MLSAEVQLIQLQQTLEIGKFNGNKGSNRKDVKKIVHSDAPIKEAPDPRWAGELSKLKDLLANQKTPV